jgi:IMP dehydrogenase
MTFSYSLGFVVLPSQTSLKTLLCRGITLNIPVLSAAMDTVNREHHGHRLAQLGGMGGHPQNMSVEEQALKVRQVKRAEAE